MMTIVVRFFVLTLSACGACATTCSAAAPQYPSRPIRLIVPASPGGAPDIQARLVANELGKQFGQQVVVENRPGASAVIGFEAIARASPDGYTIGYATFPIATNPSMFAKLPYNAFRDFEMVVHQVSAMNLLTVSPVLPVKSVQELIDYARSNSGKLSFGSGGNGTSQHLSMELFKIMTGTKLVHVPYKAIQQAITEAVSGQVHVVCDNMGSILPHVKANRLRALGVTALKRSSAMPDVPTVAEAGIPGYEIMPWSGYVVPARTTHEIIMRLNMEINKVLFLPAVSEKMSAIGSTPIGGTPEQFAEHVRRETAKWAQVLRSAGIKPE
jgi:tripartite-type tricarboxylate transporter receptor subunit TctC